eukprot:SAG22_NODE_18597_length_284_cov_1.124324_1_plen_69_part_01
MYGRTALYAAVQLNLAVHVQLYSCTAVPEYGIDSHLMASRRCKPSRGRACQLQAEAEDSACSRPGGAED